MQAAPTLSEQATKARRTAPWGRSSVGVRKSSSGKSVSVQQNSFAYSLPEGVDGVVVLRDALRSLCARHLIAAPVVDEVVLATQEACNNALMHSDTAQGTIEIRASVVDSCICVEVKDRGRGLAPDDVDTERPPDPLEAHGRGLFIIHNLMDSLEIIPCQPGTLVRMTKAC